MGDRPTGSFWVRLDSNSAMLQQWQVPGLSPRHGGNDRVLIDHSWQAQITAPPQLTLQADLAGQVGEPCDPNNTRTFTFPTIQQPDLAVASLAMTPAILTGSTTSIQLSATAANFAAHGTSDNQVRVRFWDGEPGAGGTLLHTRVIERGSNANVTTVSYDWHGFAPGPNTVVVEVAPATDETGLANNRQRISFFVPYGQNFIYVPILTRSRGNAPQGAPKPKAMPSYKSSPRLDLFQ